MRVSDAFAGDLAGLFAGNTGHQRDPIQFVVALADQPRPRRPSQFMTR